VIAEHRFGDALEEMQKLPFVRSGAMRLRVEKFD
jgi:homoserine dehydrogenase